MVIEKDQAYCDFCESTVEYVKEFKTTYICQDCIDAICSIHEEEEEH